MHFSENPGMVRFDRFKESGKWYDTYEVDMFDYWDATIIPHDALNLAITASPRFGEGWVNGWLRQGGFIVCLEPYHKSAYPVVLKLKAAFGG